MRPGALSELWRGCDWANCGSPPAELGMAMYRLLAGYSPGVRFGSLQLSNLEHAVISVAGDILWMGKKDLSGYTEFREESTEGK